MTKPLSRTRAEWALILAAAGLKIFPLPPNGKTPMIDDWPAVATSDAAQISQWFEDQPDMNYGVCAGNDFLLVDADEKLGKNGIQKFIELNMEQSADDWCLDTFTVKSPSKGLHYYLRTTTPVSNADRSWPDGIDIRGARGYVVGPGCHTTELKDHRGVIKSYEGDYTVEDECEFAQAPQWVLNRCFQHFERTVDASIPLVDLDMPANVERAREFLGTRKPAIEGSRGDEWTYQTIAKLKDFGTSEEMAFGLLTEPGGWNARCEPPWATAELSIKIGNVFNYGQNKPGNKSDLWDSPGAFTPEEYLKGVEQEKTRQYHELNDHLLSPDQIINSDDYREMVIPEWLIATGYTALLAKRGTGKTVQMVDMACRIACDMNWHDMPIMEGFAVIYICGEDSIGARDMVRAWIKQHKVMPEKNRFFFMDRTVDLLSRDSVEMWANFLRDRIGGGRAVTFLDTWQRASSQGDQNDNVEMQTAVHHVEALARSFRGPVIIAAHPPKSGASTVLGSSVIENDTSAIWNLDREANCRTLRVERIKGLGEGNYQQFEYQVVGLGGKDYFGRDRTGIVPKRIGGTTTIGSFEEDLREQSAQSVYAHAIRDVMCDAEADPEFKPAAATFTVLDMANRLVSLPRDSAHRKGFQEIGESLQNATMVANRLKKLLQVKGRYDFPDYVASLTIEQGPRAKFKLVAQQTQAAATA